MVFQIQVKFNADSSVIIYIWIILIYYLLFIRHVKIDNVLLILQSDERKIKLQFKSGLANSRPARLFTRNIKYVMD